MFTRENGCPVRPDTFYRRFRKLTAAAGLPPIPLHGLRHSAATWHLKSGTPAKIVAEMLGHASVTQTLDTYSAVLPGMHEAAVAAFGVALDR